ELPLRRLFETATVAGLAIQIEASHQAEATPPVPAIVPVPRDGHLPLSYAQRRLWFLDQLSSGNPFYNMPLAMRLSGALHVAALEQSLQTIVRRHESLRTNFVAVDGQPVQVIVPQPELVLPVSDL